MVEVEVVVDVTVVVEVVVELDEPGSYARNRLYASEVGEPEPVFPPRQ